MQAENLNGNLAVKVKTSCKSKEVAISFCLTNAIEREVIMKKQIFDLIKQYDVIIIHRHERPDEDAYGSQCGLAELIRASYPDKKVYRVGKDVEFLHHLARMDNPPDAAWQGALAIITDTANTDRIDDKRYELAEKCIKIDHHPNREPYGDICWVDTDASSASEMIYDWFLENQNLGLVCNIEAARLLYAGIVGDTGRFLYPSTTGRTFQYASELIAYGFDRTKLYAGIYELPLNLIKLHGYVLNHFEILDNHVGKIAITKAVREEYGVSTADCSRLVSVLGDIKGIKAWALFSEDEQIRVNLRSKGPAINSLAEKYGGGGHPLASGANVANWKIAEQLTEDLVDLCRNK